MPPIRTETHYPKQIYFALKNEKNLKIRHGKFTICEVPITLNWNKSHALKLKLIKTLPDTKMALKKRKMNRRN